MTKQKPNRYLRAYTAVFKDPCPVDDPRAESIEREMVACECSEEEGQDAIRWWHEWLDGTGPRLDTAVRRVRAWLAKHPD